MAKKLFLAVVVLMFCCASAFAKTEKFANETELMTWVTHYYQHPEPKVVDKAVKDGHELKVLQQNRYVPILIGFFAGVFQTNKDLRQPIGDLRDSIPLPQVERHAILRGLYFSTKNDDPSPLLAKPIDVHKTPLIVDILFGYFYATGDEAAVKKTIEALPWSTMKEEDVKNDEEKKLRREIGIAAKQELTTNAAKHQRVMDICKKELPKQSSEVKPILQEVISQAEKGPVAAK